MQTPFRTRLITPLVHLIQYTSSSRTSAATRARRKPNPQTSHHERGDNTKLLVRVRLRERVHPPGDANMDGEKLDMGVLLLRCLHADHFRWPAFHGQPS